MQWGVTFNVLQGSEGVIAMAIKPRIYHGEQADVSYDLRRCIHAEECVKRLSGVFSRDKIPWAQPDNASPDELLETVMHCPSGALHVERKDDGEIGRASCRERV